MVWVGVDFDGTLVKNAYPGVGAPVMPMVELVQRLLEQGVEVRIFTNRADRESDCAPVRAFCVEQFGWVLRITATKDRDCYRIYDDIAIQVETDTGRLIT